MTPLFITSAAHITTVNARIASTSCAGWESPGGCGANAIPRPTAAATRIQTILDVTDAFGTGAVKGLVTGVGALCVLIFVVA